MQPQMSLILKDIQSENQLNFRQGHSSQQCFLEMIEKWKKY